MAKLKYYIGELGFKTKKASYEYTKNIIYSLGQCKINKNHKYFNFFCDLIQNHENKKEKIGCGIKNFIIKSNLIFKKYLSVFIERNDNTLMDFSWVCCAKHTFNNQKHNLIQAMRYSIKPQIYEFKKHQKIKCQICFAEDKIQYDVDHKAPSFKKISETFLKNNNSPKTFADHPNAYHAIFYEKDKEFKNKWNQYHKENAILQILCHECNLKKGSK